MGTNWAPVVKSGIEFAFNVVPISVGLYILTVQEKNLKETLATQDRNQKEDLKNLKETLATQDRNQRETLAAQDKNQKEDLKNLKENIKEALGNQDDIWNLRFSNVIDLIERKIVEKKSDNVSK
jgi:poly(3-hydroxyalkanoate) synthetase